jgi:hypothetical protein
MEMVPWLDVGQRIHGSDCRLRNKADVDDRSAAASAQSELHSLWGKRRNELSLHSSRDSTGAPIRSDWT